MKLEEVETETNLNIFKLYWYFGWRI